MGLADGAAGWSWNPVADVQQMWAYPFMVNAFRAGAIVAVLAGAIGWFMVLRRQSFAGHTLSAVAFPGAAGATLVGVGAVYGYFTFCVGAALVIAAIPRAGGGAGSGGGTGAGGGEEAAVTGTVQAFLLGAGFLFIALYKGFLGGVDALLFGSFLGITAGQVRVLAVVGAVVLLVLAAVGRPLLFASVDPAVAAARGVPVRLLSAVFLVVLGAATAATSQITGALLVFALLVMPAATAQNLTARPVRGLAGSVLIALVVTWTSLTVAYYSPYPIGFWVTSFAFAAYAASWGARLLRERAGRAPDRAGPGAVPAEAAAVWTSGSLL
ncbi:metal ABC transporter permease [Streptomyces sp. CA2R106]|uniref:metal ABC transporter permease n=1 Tax=Streptomyces sp. CA2R106 TaxID=3120153 RepID=UPI003009BC7C